LNDISGDMDRLADAVDGADGAPSPDAESGYRKREQALAVALKTWSTLAREIETALRSP